MKGQLSSGLLWMTIVSLFIILIIISLVGLSFARSQTKDTSDTIEADVLYQEAHAALLGLLRTPYEGMTFGEYLVINEHLRSDQEVRAFYISILPEEIGGDLTITYPDREIVIKDYSLNLGVRDEGTKMVVRRYRQAYPHEIIQFSYGPVRLTFTFVAAETMEIIRTENNWVRNFNEERSS